jgi:hypothetical protein
VSVANSAKSNDRFFKPSGRPAVWPGSIRRQLPTSHTMNSKSMALATFRRQTSSISATNIPPSMTFSTNDNQNEALSPMEVDACHAAAAAVLPGSTASVASHRRILNITDFPDETLAAVAKFLPKPSRALFAVAMTDPTLFLHKSNWELVSSATTNRAILSLVHLSSNDNDDDNYVLEDEMIVDEENSDEDSNYNSDGGGEVIHHEDVVCDYDDDYYIFDRDESEDSWGDFEDYVRDDEEISDDEDDSSDDESWATLDFEEIEESLAAKLSDDDIRGVLICIDGVHRLRTICLCGCVGITGSGLDPLMGSTLLRKMDLSLVKRTDSPEILPKPNMSEASIIPILRSIVGADGSSLKDILLPYKLQSTIYNEGIMGPVRGFHRFIDKYYDLGDHEDLLRRLRSSRN